MKKKISTVIVILIIIAGLSLLLYPTVSDYLKNIAYNRAIESFKSTVAAIDDEAYEKIMESARERNKMLLARGNVRATLSDKEIAEYEKLLKIDDSGVMGYVVIPKIDVSLPIYHGTDDTVLQNGVGHLAGSSLPIGGKGTHSILSGHRGLPSSKLFTNIDQLAIGDTFTVRVLKEVLTYEVDDIKTVLPSEIDALQIVEEEDYCTLLTCTPYGVNSHRLLVRGRRIPTPDGEDAEAFDRINSDQSKNDYTPPLALIAAVIAVIIIIIAAVLRRKHKSKSNNASKYNFSKGEIA